MLRNNATGEEKRRLLSWSTPSLPRAPWFDRDAEREKQRLKEQSEALRATLRTKDELARALEQQAMTAASNSSSLVGRPYGDCDATPSQADSFGKRSPQQQPRVLSRVLSARGGGGGGGDASHSGSRSPSPDPSRATASPGASFDERLRAIFNKFDEDGSGSVSVAELGNITKLMKLDLPSGELAKLIESADADRSGNVRYLPQLGPNPRLLATPRTHYRSYSPPLAPTLPSERPTLTRGWQL